MLLETGSNGLFAGLLAGTVDTCRGYAVGFPVRSIGRTGKNIVGGDVQQRNAGFPGRLGKVADTIAIDRIGLLGMCFSIVDMGIGRGIDDQARLQLPNGPGNFLALADVQHGPAHAKRLEAKASRTFHHFVTDLAIRPANKNPHLLCLVVRSPRWRTMRV